MRPNPPALAACATATTLPPTWPQNARPQFATGGARVGLHQTHRPTTNPAMHARSTPRLHAGARRLAAPAEQAWLSHSNSSTGWEDLVQQLRRAPPVAWQTLHHTLVALQEITAQTAGPLPPAEANIPDKLAAARRSLPKATQVHLPWVLTHLTEMRDTPQPQCRKPMHI